jgi:DNA-binding response OmpR family regulator
MMLPPRILYVDDDRMNIELMAYWLSKDRGFDLTTAMDGREAGNIMKDQKFDLFLLDYCLPDTTAAALCRQIRQINPTVPIIVYSALDREVDRKAALDAGANTYLVKPEDIHLIEPTIDRLLGRTENSHLNHSLSRHGTPASRRRSMGIV